MLCTAQVRHLKLERGDSVILSRPAGPAVRHLTVIRQPAAAVSSYPVASIAAIACAAKDDVAAAAASDEQPVGSDHSGPPSDDPLSTDTTVDIAFIGGELEGGHTQPEHKRARDAGEPESSKRSKRVIGDVITMPIIDDSDDECEWVMTEAFTGAAVSAGTARTAGEAGSAGAERIEGVQGRQSEAGKVRKGCSWDSGHV